MKNKTLGNVNIRKGATIGYLKQIYEKEQEDIIVGNYLKESFKEFTLMENRLRELENEMANPNQKFIFGYKFSFTNSQYRKSFAIHKLI